MIPLPEGPLRAAITAVGAMEAAEISPRRQVMPGEDCDAPLADEQIVRSRLADARVQRLHGGTTEIVKEAVARSLFERRRG